MSKASNCCIRSSCTPGDRISSCPLHLQLLLLLLLQFPTSRFGSAASCQLRTTGYTSIGRPLHLAPATKGSHRASLHHGPGTGSKGKEA
eukprot:m.285030 g.285030  ORF g.285030 m.285030 type:complete len:89 (+) comp11280_c0_seq1:1440-1706(+)